MAGEYNASVASFVSTVVVLNWKGTGRTARMNTSDYLAERDGAIIEPATLRANAAGASDPPNKDPRLDADGNRIAEQASPLLRA